MLTGARYKMISREVKAYVQGKYGIPPGPVSEELKKRVLTAGEQPITCRPADLIPPGYEARRAEIGDLAKTEEDVLTYTMFPADSKKFLQKKYGA